MGKKNFKSNPALNFISNIDRDIEPPDIQSPDFQKNNIGEQHKNKSTEGKKHRVNIYLYEGNFEYLDKMYRIKNKKSITDYLNSLIYQDREANADLLEQFEKMWNDNK